MKEILKALNLWVELTGVDPNSKVWTSKSWDIHKINEELKESLTLDTTNITTMIMLEYFTTQYLNERSFTVNEVITNYTKFLTYLQKSKELYSILQSKELKELAKDFRENTLSALKHYGIGREDVFKMVEDGHALAFLRRDALKSMEQLSVHQFLQGEPDKQKPKYHKEVFEFWNINSLIKSMAMSPQSGISLTLIRDQLQTSSYFVFTIRNGGTLTVLTDKPHYTHPKQKYMSRRPGKNFSERIFRNHFPYSLMDLEFDYRGDAHISHKSETSLVSYQAVARPLKAVKDLEPDEVIWIIMMFSLIEERFWNKNFKTKELSYTGEMLKVNDALIGPCQDLIPVSSYKRIEASSLTSADVTTENMLNEWEQEPTQKNLWIEKRYEGEINNDLLNLAGDSSSGKLPVLTGSGLISMTPSELKEHQFFSRGVADELMEFDATNFGSATEIISDQRWVARYNKAVILSQKARQEFTERKDEIVKWYEDAITKNVPELLKAVGTGVFNAPGLTSQVFGWEKSGENNILRIFLAKDTSLSDYGGFTLKKDFGYDYRCFINGTPVTIKAQFIPETAEALAMLCGMQLEKLPDVLQYWVKRDPYTGNSILERIDPLEWVVVNPWQKINFNVTIFLSKSAYNQLRKDNGLPPNRFWLKKEAN